MKSPALLLCLLLAACAPPAPTVAEPLPAPPPSSAPAAAASSAPAAPAAPKIYQADKDMTVTTARGATFPVAAGWHVTEAHDRITLEDPDRKLKMVFFEIEAATGAEAIDLAWKLHDEKFVRKVASSINPPPKDWDEVVQTIYETDPSAHRLVLANARRKGKISWTAILDSERGTLDRRGAQLQNTVDGLKVPGMEEETYAGKTARVLSAEQLKGLGEFFEKTRAALGVPGAALAVVQGGKVVLELGSGVRELGKKGEVTPKTLFLIGSTTKSLSTLLMAKAVDEGKFTWETKAKAVYPPFTLGDAALADQVTMQNLVCACTGIPRYDMELLFSYDKVKPEGLLKAMSNLKPTTRFGETFQYNNQMVAAGGFLAAHALYPRLPLGDAFDRALQEKVLGPLGMKDTTLSFAEAKKRGVAGSHDEDENGAMKPMPLEYETFVVPLRPSGGAFSNVQDMAKYLQAELASGKSVTGVQVASEANVLLRRKPQVKISDDAGYGLGLMGGKYKGVPVVEHGGATFGHRSTFFFLPDHGVGITILSNGPGPLGSLTKGRLLELLFDGKPAAEAALAFQLEEKKKGVARFKEKLADAEPADVTRALAGTYKNDMLGEIKITESKNQLTLDAGEWKSRIGWKKRPDGKKDLVLLDPPVSGLSLERREKDGKTALFLSFLQHEYFFTRP